MRHGKEFATGVVIQMSRDTKEMPPFDCDLYLETFCVCVITKAVRRIVETSSETILLSGKFHIQFVSLHGTRHIAVFTANDSRFL